MADIIITEHTPEAVIDPTAQTVTELNADGTHKATRAFTADEIADLQAQLAQAKADADAVAAREAQLKQIVDVAQVKLAADAAAATKRAADIQAALVQLQADLDGINAYTFNGTTIALVNQQLNTALKPTVAKTFTRLIQVAQMLADNDRHRAEIDSYVSWLGDAVTNDLK